MPNIEIPGKGAVEFPDSMSQDQILDAVRKLSPPQQGSAGGPRQAGPLLSSPQGFYGPGVLANLESRMTGQTPQEAYEKRVPQLETAAGLLGAAVAPGSGVLRQAGGQALMAGGQEALKGTGPLRAIGKGLEGGVGALVGGGMAQGLIGQPARQAAAKVATGAFERATAGREAGIKATEQAHKATGAFNKEMTGALNTMEKESFTVSKAKFADDSAAAIAKDLKKNVPALKAFSEDQKGLGDMLYGKGKAAVSRQFDKALKDVARKGKGRQIQVPLDVAESLGLKSQDVGGSFPLTGYARDALERGGRLPPAGTATVDAGDLANAAIGQWRTKQNAYRSAMEALDNAKIGDPAARGAYKYYIGQLGYFNATKAMKGERFSPDAYRAGATTQNVEKLRIRGIGSLTEGPMELTKGGPLAPTPRQVPPGSPLPAPPPEIPKPDIRTRKNPIAGHPYLAGLAAEGAATGLGHHGFGLPMMGGFALANAMPKDIVTKTPGVNPLIQALIQAITKGGGAAGSTLGP